MIRVIEVAFLERALAWGTIGAILLATGPPLAAQDAAPQPAAGSAVLGGKIVDASGPVRGAVVHAYHLSTETGFDSAPTGANGEFVIEGLPYGYFDVAVETTDGGLYVADLVANVPPAGRTNLQMTLSPGGSATMAPRPFPGSDAEPTGVALVEERARGREFWRGPKGIAILVGLGAVGLLAIASGGGSETTASPSTP